MGGKYFRLTLFSIILAELFSFCVWYFDLPQFNTIVFFTIAALALILALVKLEYGLYIILAELFIGSKGYLFYLDLGQILISLRIGLFLIVIAVWLLKLIQKKVHFNFRKSKLFTVYGLLFIVFLWGVSNGLLRGNSWDNLFFDANGWLYFALIFVLFDVITSGQQVKKVLSILAAAVSWLAIKTVLIFACFAWDVNWLTFDIYHWVSQTGVGEITYVAANFWRIFFQSHMYSLVAFFIFFCLWIKRDNLKVQKYYPFLIFCTCLPILISFSRSFWLGGIVTSLILFCILKFYQKFPWFKLFNWLGRVVLIFVVSIGLIYVIVGLPSWSQGKAFGALIGRRITELREPAASSRMNQLGPLFKKITKHPILGSGFGTTVRYQSEDPRILEEYPDGWISTYAFEWGWLDIWLKIGLVGMVAYFLLLWKIFRQGWENTKYKGLILGLLMGLVAIAITSITSPYLNHPLGIGYIILISAIISVCLESKK